MFVTLGYFKAEEIFLLEAKERGGGRNVGLFYFLILSAHSALLYTAQE